MKKITKNGEQLVKRSSQAADTGLYEELAEKYDTPFYVYDGNLFEQRYQQLKHCLPESFHVFYAIKANPLLGVAQLFQRLGCAAEVVSEGELQLALSAGFPAGDIIYTCPGKTSAGIQLALQNDIHALVLESIDEARRVNAIAQSRQQTAAVAIRINPGSQKSNATLRMTGLPSQFGVDLEDLDVFMCALQTLPSIQVVGIHVYSGTQILDKDQLLADAREIFDLAAHFKANHHCPMQLIDIGGGFGVPYQSAESGLDLSALEYGYSQLWKHYRPLFPGVRVVVESGRFLTAEGGAFVTRVTAVKRSKGKTFVICDGGYAQHPAWMHIERTKKNRFPVTAIHKRGPKEKVTVVGPSGTPLDILAKDIWLDKVQAGDLIRVEKSGAYGFTNSCQWFLSTAIPAEVIMYQGKEHLLRQRSLNEHIFANQNGLDDIALATRLN